MTSTTVELFQQWFSKNKKSILKAATVLNAIVKYGVIIKLPQG